MNVNRAGIGYFAPARFSIPQNPFYGGQASGMAGLGCGSCDSSYSVGYGNAYPVAYAPGGMGAFDFSGGTGISFLDNLFPAGSVTVPGAIPVIGGIVISYTWLAVAAVGAYLVFHKSRGGGGRHRNPRRRMNPRRRANRRRTHRRRNGMFEVFNVPADIKRIAGTKAKKRRKPARRRRANKRRGGMFAIL